MKEKFLINRNKKFKRVKLVAPPIKMKEFSNIVKKTLSDNLGLFDENIRSRYNCSIWSDLKKKDQLYKIDSDLACEVLGYILYTYDFDFCKKVKEDLSSFNFGEQDFELICRDKTSTGLPFIEYSACYNYEPNTVLYFYWDGEYFRVFIPTVGNWINLDTKKEMYVDLREDVKYLEDQGINLSEVGITENSSSDEILDILKYMFREKSVSLDSDFIPVPCYEECKKEFEICLNY